MNIYVAKFDVQMQDEDLKNLFVPYGNVQSATIEMDAFTGQSRGFGYVVMSDENEAKAAIVGLNETLQNGRTIMVKTAEPKEIKSGSYKVGDGGVNPYRFKKN